jgi:ketosteroid isomerase-like protein
LFGLGNSAAKKVVRRYVACLNARDLDGVAALLHPECRFIDSHGDWIEGREAIIAATRHFFAIEHRFRLTLETIVEHDGEILLRGKADAEREEFRQDALWKARIEDGAILCWQSFGPQSAPRLARILRSADEEEDAAGETASTILAGPPPSRVERP